MQRRIWLPLLLIALVAAVYYEFGTVKTMEHDTVYSGPDIVVNPPQHSATSQRQAPRAASRLAVGARYASLDELVADQLAAGYLRTGYFGKHWPARVTEIAADRDGISFLRQNGTRHNYTKFDGYSMKMVRLMAGDQETIVVFRSAEKR